MTNKTKIKSTKIVYPQIYAYTLPDIKENEGWIKIGYTQRLNVDDRIKEQTKTAAINLKYNKLWSNPACFSHSKSWFTDHNFHYYLRTFKNIEQRKNTEWFYYNGNPENSQIDFFDFVNGDFNQEQEHSSYQLRYEQELAVDKTFEYIKNNPKGEFLWNAKPRFGKTLTTYDLIRRLDITKVLIVTNRPAIANSWFDDFSKFIAWQTDFCFISTSDSLKDRPVLSFNNFLEQFNTGKKKMISFISLQDLKGAICFGGQYDKLDWVKKIKDWDLLVIDEAHEGIDTIKTDVAFDNIDRNFTLHLSGTPFKAVASGKFDENEIYNWSYADEQQAKLCWNNPEENNPYEALPQLNLFSYQMSSMITEQVNQGAKIDGENIDYAFDLNEFFETNEKGKFIHEKDIRKWLDTLTQNEKYPFSTKELRNELKHTFWLLHRVSSAKALQKLLQEHPVFENYKIILAAGDGKSEDDQIGNEKSLQRVKEAIKRNDKTITLSVGQLTTGITIPEWTAVLMLSNMKSPSQYMQAAFRSQNPWKYENNGQVYKKENAYVFDFAPERTLIIYDEFANNLSNQTSNGGGTTDIRKDNIKNLLNFFPVIAEDNEGKMVELDVNQVLTIPKAIKAREVVSRGFMSNLLFQNVSGIFASREVREILEQLTPVDPGKKLKSNNPKIDTLDVQLDEDGNVIVDQEIVIAQTEAHFGEKVYENILAKTEESMDSNSKLSKIVENTFKQQTKESVKELAKENDLSVKIAEQILEKSAQVIGREIEYVEKQADIKKAEIQVEYKKAISETKDELQIQNIKANYEFKQKQIEQDLKQEVSRTIENKVQELNQRATETILQKVEEKKKNYVEDDIRARLRGFARTIPSFLMAYGNESTTLCNLDHSIDNDVFIEVTGITLEQFKLLRDEHHFFDEAVFNESIQEFLKKRKELANYFDENQTEDIFDYIPPQKTNQIFTPKKVVKLMVDLLYKNDQNIFKDKKTKFIDLYSKSGLYIAEIIKRLNQGLKEQIPDDTERLKWIIENQVYACMPSNIIFNIVKNYIFNEIEYISIKNFIDIDLLEYAENNNVEYILKEKFGENVKFDVIVGNPPYQQPDKNSEKGSAKPIYNIFLDEAKRLNPNYISFIIPSVWFTGGKGLDSFRVDMLNDRHLKEIYNYLTPQDIFPNINLRGGVNYFLWDSSYDNNKNNIIIHNIKNNQVIDSDKRPLSLPGLDLLIIDNKAVKILNKLINNNFININPNSENMLMPNISSRNPFGFDTKFRNDPLFKKEKKLLKNPVKIYASKGSIGYVEKDLIVKNQNWIDTYKVLTPFANNISTDLPDDNLNTLISEPNSIATETYLVIGVNLSLKSHQEAVNLSKYLKTKFVRFLISLSKANQNGTRSTYKFVPLQDFTENSDIDWNLSSDEIDEQLFKKYLLSEDEKAHIRSSIKSM